jgi:hypothetical protein
VLSLTTQQLQCVCFVHVGMGVHVSHFPHNPRAPPAPSPPPQVSRGVKLANTLLALSPGQLPLVKLADFGFSKDIGRHSAPNSQVGVGPGVAGPGVCLWGAVGVAGG